MKLIGLIAGFVLVSVIFGCKNEPFPKFEVDNYEERLKLFINEDFGMIIYRYYDSVDDTKLFSDNVSETPFYWLIANETKINIVTKGVSVIDVNYCYQDFKYYDFTISEARKIEEKRFKKGAAINQPIVNEKGTFPIKKVLLELYGEQILKDIMFVCK